MSTTTQVNRRFVLARRPQGAPVPEDFRLERHPLPNAGPAGVLLRTRYLSLDPYMRGRMNEGPSYAPPVALGAVMTGQTVSVVEASGVPGFKVGDLVVANVGWQDYGVSDGRDLVKIDASMPRPSYALGVLGMPGLTAYVSTRHRAAAVRGDRGGGRSHRRGRIGSRPDREAQGVSSRGGRRRCAQVCLCARGARLR